MAQHIKTWDVWCLEPDPTTNGKTLEPVIYGLKLVEGEALALVRKLSRRYNPVTKESYSPMVGRSGEFDLEGSKMNPQCIHGEIVPERSGRALMLTRSDLL